MKLDVEKDKHSALEILNELKSKIMSNTGSGKAVKTLSVKVKSVKTSSTISSRVAAEAAKVKAEYAEKEAKLLKKKAALEVDIEVLSK